MTFRNTSGYHDACGKAPTCPPDLLMSGGYILPEALRSLGEPLEVHPPKAGARAGYLIIAAILALLAVLAVVGIVNPPMQNPPPPVVLVALMGVFLMGSLTCLGLGFFAQSYTLILFPDALTRVGSGAPGIFRWTDIKETYTFIHPIAGKHRLVTQDGRTIEIDGRVKDGKQLGLTVQKMILDRTLPGAIQCFERGLVLSFGPLRIDENAIHYKDRRLAWTDIGKIGLQYNAFSRCVQLEVREAGTLLLPWCIVKAQEIPNLDVFKNLIERKTAFTPQTPVEAHSQA
jgi:hypothetical protein